VGLHRQREGEGERGAGSFLIRDGPAQVREKGEKEREVARLGWLGQMEEKEWRRYWAGPRPEKEGGKEEEVGQAGGKEWASRPKVREGD
jgi:hypothetical protein